MKDKSIIETSRMVEAEKLSNKPVISGKGIIIVPIEVELYRYDASFKDDSVHCNELQQNNYGHFYVHRFGKKAEDPYKGRAGVDWCWSEKDNLYYSWLIRSAIIQKDNRKEFCLGPMKVLAGIRDMSGMDNKQLESSLWNLSYEGSCNHVFFSKRINLSPCVSPKWKEAELRLVVADDEFQLRKFKMKSVLVFNYIKEEFYHNRISSKEGEELCKKYLGYLSGDVKKILYK